MYSMYKAKIDCILAQRFSSDHRGDTTCFTRKSLYRQKRRIGLRQFPPHACKNCAKNVLTSISSSKLQYVQNFISKYVQL